MLARLEIELINTHDEGESIMNLQIETKNLPKKIYLSYSLDSYGKRNLMKIINFNEKLKLKLIQINEINFEIS